MRRYFSKWVIEYVEGLTYSTTLQMQSSAFTLESV